MAVQIDGEPWPAITKAVQASSARIVAGIGYIGLHAHDLLPLRSGDVLLCDASDITVRSGATNPHGLRPFLDAGVQVFSAEGLHAKVVVLRRRAFVGSMNASNHSANHLTEASIETTAPTEVGHLRNFVLNRCRRQLGAGDVERLIELMPKRPPKRPAARAATIPGRLDRVVVLGFEIGEWSKSAERAHSESIRNARQLGRRMGGGVRTEPIDVGSWVFGRVRALDWVIQQSKDDAYSPGLVIEKVPHRTGGIIWLARPEMTLDHIPLDHADGVLSNVAHATFLSGNQAVLAVDLFR